MRLTKSRLLAVAAAAGTVCALGTGVALAGSLTYWTGGKNPVPGAFTNASPALAQYFNNSNVPGTFIAWKAQRGSAIYYRATAGNKTTTGAIPGAKTSDGPAAAFYPDPLSKNAEIVVWKNLKNDNIMYSTGEVTSANTLTWTTPRNIAVKGDKGAQTDEGPAVAFAINSPNARVIIAWRGPGHHVRYELGTPTGRLFSFDPSDWISGGTTLYKTTTSSTPALAEILNQSTGNGTIYVFWKADGKSELISYASTPDLKNSGLQGSKTIPWTLLGTVPNGASTIASSTSGPSATSINPHGFGPLLLAYKGPTGEAIRYQTLTGTSWSNFAYVTGTNNRTTVAPAVLNSTLANVSNTVSARIYLHIYHNPPVPG
jgi:hypothetical protein